MSTKIEWTDETWNPIAGCNDVSEGCRNCYARTMAGRLEAMGVTKYAGLTVLQGSHRVWTGKISFDEKALLAPLRRKKSARYFVNSMSDLFHENVTDEMRDRIFAVMALCPQHTFQILTKRPERMPAYLSAENPRYTARRVFDAAEKIDPENGYRFDVDIYWPLPNVWLGVSVEDQKTADEHPDWARSLRDQCEAAGVSFFFKQWGEWAPGAQGADYSHKGAAFTRIDVGGNLSTLPTKWLASDALFYRVGKKAAGHLLDGKEYHQFPAVTNV